MHKYRLPKLLLINSPLHSTPSDHFSTFLLTCKLQTLFLLLLHPPCFSSPPQHFTENYSVPSMERPQRLKEASMMSYFKKAATFSVSNPPHSPGRRSEKGFSGPIVSIIPKEARHKKRSNSVGAVEPSSPKISCMGQIKPKRKKKKSSWRERRKEKAGKSKSKRPRRRLFCPFFNSLFRRRARTGGVPEKETEERTEKKWVSAVAPAPGSRLSKMNRYKSGREPLGDFDWTKAADGNRGEEEEEEIFIPHSAPILMGSGPSPAPPLVLGKMRQYQSGREKLGDFDWRKTVERNRGEEEEEEEEIFIRHSAPLTAGGRAAPRPPSGLSKMTRYRSGHETLGDFDWTKAADLDQDEKAEEVASGSPEPKKGLNLWRRRETAPPIPLQI